LKTEIELSIFASLFLPGVGGEVIEGDAGGGVGEGRGAEAVVRGGAITGMEGTE